MKRLLEFFSDTGTLSSGRLIMITWGVGVFLVWAICSLVKHGMCDIPSTVITFFVAAATGKVVQSINDNKTPPSNPPS